MSRAVAHLNTSSRRRLILGVAALPATVAVACGGPAGTGQPATQSIVPGKVLVVSYQTSSPRLDRQIANYEEFNREFKPQRSKVDGWGLFLLKNWKKADTELIPVYAGAKAGKIPVAEFTTKAQDAVTRHTSF
jgi:hypothetical protein